MYYKKGMTKKDLALLSSNLISSDLAFKFSCCDVYLFDEWLSGSGETCNINFKFSITEKDWFERSRCVYSKFCKCINKTLKLIIREYSDETKIKDFNILALDHNNDDNHKLKIVDIERYEINHFTLLVIDFEITDEDTISEINFSCRYQDMNERL